MEPRLRARTRDGPTLAQKAQKHGTGSLKMGSRRQPRVLMLGWEYPPRFAGGLGKACRGLSNAMARQGARVFFVLPTFPERIVENHLEVVGARECLIDAGWTEEAFRQQGSQF